MSGKKNATEELIAIYRLEFYRKQSNWKLSNDKKKSSKKKTRTPVVPPTGSPAEARHALNETYNVSLPKTDAASSLHNNAFLESDSNVQQVFEQPEEAKLTTEPQDKQLPNNTNPSDKVKDVVQKRPCRIWNIPWSELVSTEGWSEELRDGGCGLNGDGWPATSELWSNTGHTDNIPESQRCVSRDLMDGNQPSAPSTGGPELDDRRDQPWSVAEQLTWTDERASEEDQFLLEAHLGPHSTAISQCVQETATDALRELLSYAERHVELPSHNSTREEEPTHDVDPTYFTRTTRKIPDVILSGSHNNYVHFNLDAERFGNGFNHVDQHVGHVDRNVGHVDQNVGHIDSNITNYDKEVRQCIENVGNFVKETCQYDKNSVQYSQNVRQHHQKIDRDDIKIGQYNRNVEQYNNQNNQNVRNGQYASNNCQYAKNMHQYNKTRESNRNTYHSSQYYRKSQSDIPQWQYINHNDLKEYQCQDNVDRNNNLWEEGRGRGRGRNSQQGIAIEQGRPYRVESKI